jgi:hypothetical protein
LSTVSDDFNFFRVKLNSWIDPGLALTTDNAQFILNYPGNYQFFMVTHASIEVDFVNTDNDVPVRVSVVPSFDDPTRVPTWTADSALLRVPNSISRMLGNANGMDRATIRMTVDIGHLAGVGKLTTAHSDFIGVTSAFIGGAADPIADGSFIIAAQSLVSATDNIDVISAVRVSYRTVFFGLVVPLYSTPTLKQLPLREREKYYATVSKATKRHEHKLVTTVFKPMKTNDTDSTITYY